jgi:hypothetical protein
LHWIESVFNLLAKKIEVIAVHLFSAKAKLAVTEPSESQKELMNMAPYSCSKIIKRLPFMRAMFLYGFKHESLSAL